MLTFLIGLRVQSQEFCNSGKFQHLYNTILFSKNKHDRRGVIKPCIVMCTEGFSVSESFALETELTATTG